MSGRSVIACALLGALMNVACAEDPEVAKQRHLADGNRYMADKKYTEAIISYRNAVDQDPRFGEARFRLSEAHMAAGDPASALAEAVRAADLLSDNADAQLRAGFLLLMSRQFPEARARASAVLSKDSRNVRALILFANALAGLKDVEAAVEYIEQAIDEDPGLTLGYANLGAIKAAKGESEAAEETFRRAVTVAPESASAHASLGNFLWSAGRQEEAEASFKAAHQREPASPGINRALAALYMEQGRLGDAEPYLKAYVQSAGTTESRLLLADFFARSGKTQEAVESLELVANERTGAIPAGIRLAAIDFARNRRADAYARLETLLARDPRSEPVLEAKTRFLLLEGKNRDALSVASTLVDANPKWVRGIFIRGLALEAAGSADAAIEAYREVLRYVPSDVTVQGRLARLYLSRGRSADALPLAQQTVKAQPQSSVARLTYAQALVRAGELERAERELRALAAATPDSVDVHIWLGMLYEARRDAQNARRSFAKARELQPESDVALAGLVSADLAEKRPADALARIESALTRRPDDARLVMMSGMVHLALRDLPKAEAAYRRLLELDPDNLDAYNRLGAIFLAQNRLDDARRQFEEMAQRHERPVAAETMVGTILARQNRPKEARRHFERALKLNPRAAVAANNLAWDYANNGGDLDAALQLAQTAKAQLPEHASITDTLGWVYYKKGLSAVAVTTLREAAKQNPTSPTIQYHLGLALLQNGDKAAARATLEGVLKQHPTFPDAADARRVLSTITG